MLHATYAAGKSNRYKVYMGYRDTQNPHVHEEDEITSTILGPLDFLPAEAVHQFWQTVFMVAGYEALLPPEPPNRSSVMFWPTRRAREGGLRVEPDGRVDLFWDSGNITERRILLIEVKWRAPLSGDDQLHRQWCDYLTDEEKPEALHLFIGIETTAGKVAQASSRGDVWKDRLILISWLQVRAALSELRDSDDQLGRWSKLADHFLEKVGIRRFLGFADLPSERCAIEIPHLSIFWNRFSPWEWAAQKAFPPNQSPIFWSTHDT